MRPVAVLIFHACAPNYAGPLVRALADARYELATRQLDAFLAAGADEAEILAGPPDGLTFGERLRASAVGERAAGGIVILGSGSIPLARAADLRRFIEVAAGPPGHALANNRYSADVVAISRAADLADLPPLPADNALPRWLEERAGVEVADLRTRWRLGVDIDTPLDLLVIATAGGGAAARDLRAAAPLIGERLTALADVIGNRRAELLVAGRVSATTLKWLENGVACRVRALVEERGLRAASHLAQTGPTHDAGNARPPQSVLGSLLDQRDGSDALAGLVAHLADAAVIDTRVLLAHRHGADETNWPSAEDRFASDLLLPNGIADPWLSVVTRSAAASPAPILLGGHTLVNGGLRLLAQRARAGAR